MRPTRWASGILVAVAILASPSIARGQAGWYVTPSLSVSESFEDNIFRSSDNREHDFITSITPGLRLAYQSEPLTLVLSYNTTYAKFVEHPELDNFGNSQRGALNFNYVPGKGAPWTLSLHAAYVSTESPSEQDPASDEEGRRVTKVISGGGGLTYRFTGATSAVGRVSYAHSEVEGLAGAENDSYGAGLSLNHQLTERDTISLNYSFNLFQSETRERISNALTGGYDRQFYEDLKGGIRLGVRVTDGRVTPDVGANLDGAIRPIQGLTLSANYSDTVRFVVGEGEPKQVRTLGLAATYAPPLIQYLTLSLGPSVSYVTDLGGGNERVVYRTAASVTYSYPLASWLTAQFSYHFSYSANSREIIRNTVSVGLSAQYPIRVY